MPYYWVLSQVQGLVLDDTVHFGHPSLFVCLFTGRLPGELPIVFSVLMSTNEMTVSLHRFVHHHSGRCYEYVWTPAMISRSLIEELISGPNFTLPANIFQTADRKSSFEEGVVQHHRTNSDYGRGAVVGLPLGSGTRVVFPPSRVGPYGRRQSFGIDEL